MSCPHRGSPEIQEHAKRISLGYRTSRCAAWRGGAPSLQPVPEQPDRTGSPGQQGAYQPTRGFGSFVSAALRAMLAVT